MGIFSSSYKYYAFSGTSGLFDDNNRPNTILQLMLNGIIGGDASPPESILIGINTNLYARAKSMYKYAAKEDGYIFGFPTTNQNQYNISTTMLRPYIEADHGGPIDFRTLHWGTFDNADRRDYWLEKAISDNYLNTDYFPWIPAIGDPLDTNWSPVDDTVEIPLEDPTPGGSYYISDNKYDADIVGTTYHVKFPYDTPTQYWSVAQGFDLGGYDDGNTWIQVRFRSQGGGDEYLYWDYRIGSGDIPALEAEITSAQLDMEYLPIAVLMHDTVWFDESGDVEWEETLDRLLRDIALDPYEIKEEYLDSITNPDPETPPDSIPDIEDVWDFFIRFGVPLKTTFRGGREYLFYFYDWLRTRSTWTTFDDYQGYLSAISGGGFLDNLFNQQPYSTLSEEEGVEYTGYIARYAWSYIERVDNVGTFTPPGWAEPLKPGRCWSKTYQLGDADYNEGLDWVHGVGNYSVAASQSDGEEHSYTLVVKDLRDGTHAIILMMGPSMEYQINTSADPVGVGEGGYVDYRYRFVDVELFPDDPEEDDREFRWPIHIGTLKEVSTMQREPALADGLAATVFLVEKVKVKWYQKGFFKWLIIIIVVVVVILAWQYELLPTIAALASAATGASALALWALYVVLTFAIGFLVSFAGSLIGGTLGQIFVIVAMFMAAGGSFTDFGGNFTSAWSNLTTQPGWGSAIQFINAVSMPVKIGQEIYIAHQLHKLEDEMRDFIKTAKEKYEQLQDAWDSLQETPDWIDPLMLARTFSVSGLYENPEQFYHRTLHANPGTLGYDLIQNFTEMALMLPETPGSPQVVDAMIETFAKQRGQV